MPAVSVAVRTNIHIIYTGGTIGMGPSDHENPASPLVVKSFDELVAHAPQLARLRDEFGIHWTHDSFEHPVDSSDVAPRDWQKIAEYIESSYTPECDGFVVLHGTDTMAYTSSALAFILENLDRPVVVTGSQLPLVDVRTDALQNLVGAICIAGYKAFDDIPKIPEVVLCFADKVIRGCRATKVDIQGTSGFDSPNCPLLGNLGEHVIINREVVRKISPGGRPLRVRSIADGKAMPTILDIGVFPGISGKLLAAIASSSNADGMVLRTFGAGNAPGNDEFLNGVEKVVGLKDGKRECFVLNVSHCLRGTVEMGRYASSSGLLDRGVLSGLDLTKEAALAKLYWALGSFEDEEVADQLRLNQRGEQSQNLFDLRFNMQPSEAEPKVLSSTASWPRGVVNPEKASRIVLRVTGVSVPSPRPGESHRLRAFLNDKQASHQTAASSMTCVLDVQLNGAVAESGTVVFDITQRARGVISKDENTRLSLCLGVVHGDEFEAIDLELQAARIALFEHANI